MGLVLAAVGAWVAALLEVTIASRFQFAGAQLQILLVFGIVLTLVSSFESGITWAFFGGLSADMLGMRPLGSTVFALLITVGAASLIGRLLSSARPLDVVISVVVLAPFYLMLIDMTTALLSPPAPTLRVADLLSAALVNTVLGALITAVLYTVRRRFERGEKRTVW
jgi:rod shape-determining protein MreD